MLATWCFVPHSKPQCKRLYLSAFALTDAFKQSNLFNSLSDKNVQEILLNSGTALKISLTLMDTKHSENGLGGGGGSGGGGGGEGDGGGGGGDGGGGGNSG